MAPGPLSSEYAQCRRRSSVRHRRFEVVGVLAVKGVVVDGDEDDQVLVPARTALRRLFNVTWLSAVYVSAASPREVGALESSIAGLLTRRHPPRQARRAEFEIQNA